MAGIFGHSSAAASIPTTTSTRSDFGLSGLFSRSSGSVESTWLYTTAGIILALLAFEQGVWRYKKRHLPGATWTIPIIGKFADSLKPTMEGYIKQWDSGPLSAITVFNIFIVMASSNEFTRKILNSPTFAEPCIVASAKQILFHDNWVFLSGKAHVEFRRGLNVLFTRKALGIYTGIQDVITRKHFAKWLEVSAKDPSPRPIMMDARYLNMDTSLKVFCGPYISDEAAQEISDKYWDITKALELVNFPLALPGTKVYRAIQARKAAMFHLEAAARKAKVVMANGGEPECMLEEWIRNINEPGHKGRNDFSDHEMAMVLLSFLFASQDAMSSGLVYGLQHLVDHPDVMAKLRAEQENIRGANTDVAITLEMLDSMPYLAAVVKESLRVKPPVTMIPYKTLKPFPISSDYTVPAGSMVIPSFFNSLHDPVVYPQPAVFDPERWLDADSSANQNPKNYMCWGSGIHKCIAIEYASMNMAIVLANAAMMLNLEHDITPQSHLVMIIATLFPQDGLRLKISPRV